MKDCKGTTCDPPKYSEFSEIAVPNPPNDTIICKLPVLGRRDWILIICSFLFTFVIFNLWFIYHIPAPLSDSMSLKESASQLKTATPALSTRATPTTYAPRTTTTPEYQTTDFPLTSTRPRPTTDFPRKSTTRAPLSTNFPRTSTTDFPLTSTMPAPTITPKTWGNLDITVIQGSFPKTDFWSDTDPFVKVKVGSQYVGSTSLIKNNRRPYWNEDFFVKNVYIYDFVYFEVLDMDVTKEQWVGSTQISIKELLSRNDSGRNIYLPLDDSYNLHVELTWSATH